MAKKQVGLSLSAMEAVYTAASVVVVQMLGVRVLLHEIKLKCEEPMILYADNQAALKHLGEEASSAKSKYDDVRIKFVSSHVKMGILVSLTLSRNMLDALMTKAVAAPQLEELGAFVGLGECLDDDEK